MIRTFVYLAKRNWYLVIPLSLGSGEVCSLEDAFLYLASCQLATVSGMATKKSKSKSEFDRQKSIAQHFIDWIREFKVRVPKRGRVHEVIRAGSVEEWAANFPS